MKEPGILRQFSEQNPFIRFGNTSCSFQMTIKVLKIATNGFTCNIVLEHRHNHHINSLEVLSFKMLSDEARKEVNSLFLNNLTPSQVLLNLKMDCEDDFNFHLQKENRSTYSRQRDFNSLNIKYSQEQFGGKNDQEMLSNLEEGIDIFMDTQKESKTSYQIYEEMEELL